MPENDKIQVHLDLDSSFESYVKIKEKMIEIAEQSKLTNKAFVIFHHTAEAWKSNHPAVKIVDFLAQAAAYIYGENMVTKEFRSEFASQMHTIRITAEIQGKHCAFGMKFTEEFIHEANPKEIFLDWLADMCKSFDHQMPMAYPLTPKCGSLQANPYDPIDMTAHFTQTTSSYQYLRYSGYVEQLAWYWDNPEISFPQRLAWQGGFCGKPVEKFWYKNIQEGTYLLKLQEEANQLKFGEFVTDFNSDDYSDSGMLMNHICPGLNAVVKLPCGCLNILGTEPQMASVQVAIIHLNDKQSHNGIRKEWTREEIADWLESLDVDLTLRDNSGNTEKEN